ncbi:hypothetical protein BDR03DRAFT_1007983 [Suillus americanus]|nr:hypothetical protein BDR03DRAFT_1007983 [Suillus americanus]
MSSKKSTGHPTQKIITNRFIQDQKVQNSSNRYFYKCNYCLTSIEGRDNKHLKHILDRNICPTAPDHTRTECSGVFSGGQADALDWWETLPHYFSGLGGVQSVKRCNLSVQTLESLSKLWASYANFLHKVDHEAGKPARRKHTHMLTRLEHGLDTALADVAGPESITDEELLEEFDRFENEMLES